MSTHGCIIIKVRPEDLGSKKKFEPALVPVRIDDWGNEKCGDKSGEVTLEHPYIGIYCHFDGYPSNLGVALKKGFKDYDTALNLVVGGDCSYIEESSIKRYADRSCEDWAGITPKQGDTPEEVIRRIDCEFAYLFDGKDWKVNDFSERVNTQEEVDGVTTFPIYAFKEFDEDYLLP